MRGGKIALLEGDLGGEGLNRGQLAVRREELVRDRGGFVQLAQLQERASEAARALGAG